MVRTDCSWQTQLAGTAPGAEGTSRPLSDDGTARCQTRWPPMSRRRKGPPDHSRTTQPACLSTNGRLFARRLRPPSDQTVAHHTRGVVCDEKAPPRDPKRAGREQKRRKRNRRRQQRGNHHRKERVLVRSTAQCVCGSGPAPSVPSGLLRPSSRLQVMYPPIALPAMAQAASKNGFPRCETSSSRSRSVLPGIGKRDRR